MESDKQGYTNPESQISRATKFCTLLTKVCWSSVWNMIHVNILREEFSDGFQIFVKFVHSYGKTVSHLIVQ